MSLEAENAWAIARAWAEGERFDYVLAARLGGWDVALVRDKAAAEGWAVAEARGVRAGYDRARLQRVRNRLWARLSVVAECADDGPGTRADLDSLQLQMRALDMLERGMESNQEQEEETDIADTLARINDRIIALAHAFAGQLAADGGR